jgi:hypothetical protein
MALLDRVVDGAIMQRMNGKSYRKFRAEQKKAQNRRSPKSGKPARGGKSPGDGKSTGGGKSPGSGDSPKS